MSRPYNETEEDLEAEEWVRVRFVEKLGDHNGVRRKIELIKLQPFVYHVDWAVMVNGQLNGFAEFKRRKNALTAYRTYAISAGKWHHLYALCRTYGIRGIVVVQWTDLVGFAMCYDTKVETTPFHTGTIRRKRGQLGDYEPAVHIKTEDIIPLWEVKP